MRLFLSALLITLTTTVIFADPAPTPDPLDAVITPVTGETKELFEKAKKYFADKDYKDCKDVLGPLVAEHPMDSFIPQAKLMLAKVQDDFEISIAQLREVAEQYDDKPEGMQAQKELADRFYLADKYEDAADAYHEFLDKYEKDPMAVEVHYWLGSSYLAGDQTEKAIKEYEKVLDKGKQTNWAPKALLGMGNACFRAQKFSDAENRYLRILDQYALYDELNLVYLKLGETYEMEKKWKQAFAAYQTLVARFPKAIEVSEAQTRISELSKIHPELLASYTALPTPIMVSVTPTATEIQTPTATISAESIAPVMATPTAIATAEPTRVVEAATPEEVEQEETVDQPVLKSTPFHVQVGVYSKQANLLLTEKGLRKAGYKYYVITAKAADGTYVLYKLRTGHFATRTAAQKLANRLAKRIKEKAIVVED
jgi:TolA-binding protein